MNEPKQPKTRKFFGSNKEKNPEKRRAHALTEDSSGFLDLYWP